MSWIKRNLYFVAGAAVAVALLGLAGFYFYSKWSLNRQALTELEGAYADWERITRMDPNPGNIQSNNIGNALEQKVRVQAAIGRVQKYFAPIPPVPNVESGQLSNFEFASALRRTISQLEKEAANRGVTLPPQYGFSFEAQKPLFTLAPGSLSPLSRQLGDIKVISSILFQAKINSLDNLRRERVSSDDFSGPQSDYLEATHTSVTNDLAVLVPYEVTFQCFSTELAGALSGFASAPFGFIIKAINVVPGGMEAPLSPEMGYGLDMVIRPDTERMVPGYRPNYAGGAAYPPAGYQPVPPPVMRGGLQTVLDEKQLKVTLVLNVVRLLPRR